MKDKLWTLYIIETTLGKLYTGITTDIERRFEEHVSRKKGAKFFNSDKAKRIVYSEQHVDRSTASKREYYIKSLSKKEKLIFIGQGVIE